MKTIGIVAEYNPFHLGHAWHIRESRRLSEEEHNAAETAVIAVMSGDFVQRGEPAVFSKYARAEAACRCGADLVVELPLPWALSSAECFAEGAVMLLADMGADSLSFGCEIPDAARVSARADSQTELLLCELQELADLMTGEDFIEEVRCHLKEEPAQSFAAARQRCAEARLGRELPCLRQPNNILALEYLKAIRKWRIPMTPTAVPRQGAGHDEAGDSLIPSAAELRSRLHSGMEIGEYLPPDAEAVFRRELDSGHAVLNTGLRSRLMLSRLRWLKEKDFLSLPDAGDGLGERLYHAVRSEAGYENVLSVAATRRYPMARVRRLSVCAALGIRNDDRVGLPPFARVLAFNEKGRILLHDVTARREEGTGERLRIPVLTKPAHVRNLDARAQSVFELGAQAHDFYTLFYRNEESRYCGEDWRRGPAFCS